MEVLLQSLPATTNPLMLGAQVYCAYKILNTCKLDKVRQHRIQQKNGHATTLPAFFKLKNHFAL